MGFTPRDVDAMLLWELSACADGFSRANGAEQEAAPPSIDEHRDMVKRMLG
jgi:hypothetical protein